MLPVNNFPFDFHDVEEEETQEWNKYFLGARYTNVRVGPNNYLQQIDYKNDAADIYNLPLRTDDVFVSSFPRSGTTWTQELVWLLANDLDYSKAAAIPLTSRYVYLEFSMFITKDVQELIRNENVGDENAIRFGDMLSTRGSKIAAQTPSPRFFKTHLPLSLLPPSTLDTTKVVYVARDPRDVAVSFYHLMRLFKMFNYSGDFKTFWNLFIKNRIPTSPYFEHVKEAWQLRHHPNMLFLFYEDHSKDLPASVTRVANFLGKQLTPEQMDKLCTHLSFENFRNNPSVNMDEMKNVGMLSSGEKFIRKGKPGGWREYFDEDIIREGEVWIAKNLEDTDLSFPSMQ